MVGMDGDALRARLAELGVGLFVTTAAAPVEVGSGELAALFEALATSDDPRLRASLPALFVSQYATAPAAAEEAAARLDPVRRKRLGVVWRLARALAVSRGPDIRALFGADRHLPPLRFEAAELPDPGDECGERCLRAAREAHEGDPDGNPVGDLEDLFDAWVRIVECDRRAALHA